MNKQHITDTAVQMVQESGLINLSREALCKRADISDGSFVMIMGVTFTEFVKKLKRMDIHTDDNYTVVKSRTDPALRQRQILMVAIEQAKLIGYNKITRESVAELAGVSEGLVTRYFHTMCQLKRDVMRYAVKNNIAEIVAQGLVYNDKHAKKASPDLKKKAATHIADL